MIGRSLRPRLEPAKKRRIEPTRDIPHIPITNGTVETDLQIPQLGFGTYCLGEKKVIEPLRMALDAGYKMVDTAQVYQNEKYIGEIIAEEGCEDSIFLVTKLWRSYQGDYEKVKGYTEESASYFGNKKIDLLLLHWPGPGHHRYDPSHQTPKDWTPAMRIETLEAMHQLTKEGVVRAVGVSNFSIRQIEEMPFKPAVNQIECHPFLINRELIEYCHTQGIVVMAHTSLGLGDRKLLQNEVVVSIAQSLKRTSAQVLLRWAVQQGLVVIPRSKQYYHIQENMKIFDFEISDTDMARLDGLNRDRRYSWKGVDPDTIA